MDESKCDEISEQEWNGGVLKQHEDERKLFHEQEGKGFVGKFCGFWRCSLKVHV